MPPPPRLLFSLIPPGDYKAATRSIDAAGKGERGVPLAPVRIDQVAPNHAGVVYQVGQGSNTYSGSEPGA